MTNCFPFSFPLMCVYSGPGLFSTWSVTAYFAPALDSQNWSDGRKYSSQIMIRLEDIFRLWSDCRIYSDYDQTAGYIQVMIRLLDIFRLWSDCRKYSSQIMTCRGWAWKYNVHCGASSRAAVTSLSACLLHKKPCKSPVSMEVRLKSCNRGHLQWHREYLLGTLKVSFKLWSPN